MNKDPLRDILLDSDQEMFQRLAKKILSLEYDSDMIPEKSFHYMGFIASHPCVISRLRGVRQVGRTTVEHIGRSLGVRAPDFWTVPLSWDFHLSPENPSLETIGSNGLLEKFNLPLWEEMALLYLIEYLSGQVYARDAITTRGAVSPRPQDYHGAVHWGKHLVNRLNY